MTKITDKELADKVVALGVGTALINGLYCFGEPSDTVQNLHADVFVRDWRVAGALMEAKCWGVNIVRKGDEWETHVIPIGQIKEYTARNKSPTRAIIEAYVEASTND